jgi:FkbM family methyltransferase
MLKKIAKSILPARLFQRIQQARSWRVQPQWMKDLKARHDELNRGGTDASITMRPGVRFNVDPRARVGFEWFCWYNLEMVQEYDSFLEEAKDKQAFLDIGALHGVYSLSFTSARPGARALAVDPSPPAFEVLSENIRLNPQLSVQAANVALGEKPGTMKMLQSWHHAIAVNSDLIASSDKSEVVEVPVMTVDALLAEKAFEPDLIKIDVEGFELFVIRGASATLSRKPVDLLLEIHPVAIKDLGYTVADLTSELQRCGYRFFSPQEKMREVPKSDLDQRASVNWVVCRAGN